MINIIKVIGVVALLKTSDEITSQKPEAIQKPPIPTYADREIDAMADQFKRDYQPKITE